MKRPDFDLSDREAVSFCPSCGAGYRAGPTRCSDCNEELLSRAEVDSSWGRERELDPAGDFLPGHESIGNQEITAARPEFDLTDPDAVAFCPGCGSGYRAGVSLCVDCQQQLVPRWQVEAKAQSPASRIDSPPLVPLGDVSNPFKANLLASALKDAGIDFSIEPLGRWEILGAGGLGGALRFLVPEKDLETARQALADLDELERASPDEGSA